MPLDATTLADLTDAVARGRLTLAELAAVAPDELDTLFAVAAERIDHGRIDEGRVLLAGLVALFPYDARYWRAYGIALHRTEDHESAVFAYNAALLLQPHHPMTLCYRGEVFALLGDTERARHDLRATQALNDRAASERAARIEAALSRALPPAPRATTEPTPAEAFTLDDGRTLPLASSRAVDTLETTTMEEVTRTARIFAPAAMRLWHESTDVFERSAASEPTTPAAAPETTVPTAAPTRHVTQTAIIPGRPGVLRLETQEVAARHDAVTQTAIVLRKFRSPLLGDDKK